MIVVDDWDGKLLIDVNDITIKADLKKIFNIDSLINEIEMIDIDELKQTLIQYKKECEGEGVYTWNEDQEQNYRNSR